MSQNKNVPNNTITVNFNDMHVRVIVKAISELMKQGDIRDLIPCASVVEILNMSSSEVANKNVLEQAKQLVANHEDTSEDVKPDKVEDINKNKGKK